ncbi:PepSY-like domain-containing protein [Catalinimonas niigatensis]|uniref:PepSY-like domain-containing protein n=1 Tax=Catalinimonas niigatensis TaxID=1397264 RepID=UPI002664F689|nr:PepSY-like domain-containing protein [Catalinimonas niigatensis]WPP50725.1 PepSY-like domain-containing protein [Catalinimonas niigatensis]
MRVFMLGLLLSSYALVSCSQDIPASKVPSVVQNAFKMEFAEAVDVEWEKKNKEYEADFEVGTTDYTALFDASGKMLVYKQDIEINELPAEINTTLQKDFADYTLDDADKLVKDGETYFQVELEGGLMEKKEVFSPTGELREDIRYWD